MALINNDIQRNTLQGSPGQMNINMLTSLRCMTLMALLCLLAACGSQPREQAKQQRSGSAQPQTQKTQSIAELLVIAARSPRPQADELILQAANLALEAGNATQALDILQRITPRPVTPMVRPYIITQARLAILREQPQQALYWLADRRLADLPLTKAEQITESRLRAEAYLLAGNYLPSARERIFFDALLDEEAQSLNHDLIFDALMSLPAPQLKIRAGAAVTSDLRGWLSLAAISKQYHTDPIQQWEALNNWKSAWGYHPAAKQLPSSLEMLAQIIRDQPQVIALLLPLQGDLGTYGRAIRDGILATHYAMHGKPDIKIFDTSSMDIEQVLAQAQAAGAELVIGPLSRENVNTLARNPTLPLPVLALNRSLDGLTSPNLYQFGLAPEDEINQVADHVYNEGLRNALVIYPEGDWGSRNFAAFEDRWKTLGGHIVDSAQYANQRDYSDLVKTLLTVDQSERRAADVRRIIGERFEFTPRRRMDIDFVFLLASPAQARGINPTLAFYYADDIPVYATSHVYEISDSRIESIDLNGIRFCDIPWKLTQDNDIQRQIQANWPAARAQLSPFYALGVDAYQIHAKLQYLKALEFEKTYGVTGILQITPDNLITRGLMWAQFSKGKVIATPAVVDAN
ncbi:MAG: outer membrane PBP1 activator LpoA protein [Candidatus Azotimanducaceae bacterium]|jgi:outer membrane PBP1 activator LpoA protein